MNLARCFFSSAVIKACTLKYSVCTICRMTVGQNSYLLFASIQEDGNVSFLGGGNGFSGIRFNRISLL